jgi:hypothetical protein
VWNADDETTGNSSQFERFTVMNLCAGYHRLIPIAQELAEVLDVPLLNHATREDWKSEAQRAKQRPYESEGGNM